MFQFVLDNQSGYIHEKKNRHHSNLLHSKGIVITRGQRGDMLDLQVTGMQKGMQSFLLSSFYERDAGKNQYRLYLLKKSTVNGSLQWCYLLPYTRETDLQHLWEL